MFQNTGNVEFGRSKQAAHVAGKSNTLADRLNRYKVIPTELTITSYAFEHFVRILDTLVDLFVSHT